MVIKNRSFEHKGGFYFYRLHTIKTNKLCKKFSGLKNYLSEVFENCPHEHFNSGPRSSGLRFKINTDMVQIKGHEISLLTKQGLISNNDRYNTSHSKVQVFMLENDNNTIATEVPIWLENSELKDYMRLFKTFQPLTGHIDLLRIEDNKIWIWDYKPNAKYEKHADTQIYFYALMLSKRSGIDLDKFRCGYFDEHYAYMFKPKQDSLVKHKSLFKF